MKLGLQNLIEKFTHPADRDLVAHLNGELDASRRRRVARHLSNCPRCRRESVAYQETLARLDHPFQPISLEAGLESLRASIREYHLNEPKPARRRVSLSGVILFVAAAHLTVAFFSWMQWALTGNPRWITLFFRYQGDLFFVLFSALEFALSVFVRRRIQRGDELRPAWSVISLAAACHLIGGLFSHLFGWNPALGPYVQSPSLWYTAETANVFYQFGVAVSGPLHMATLSIGLFLVIRVYKKRGLSEAFAWSDHAMLGAVVFYSIYSLFEILTRTADPGAPATTAQVVNWASDPLLCLLLFEAVFIRRSAARLNCDVLTKSWGAYAAAIGLTLLGDVGLWMIAHGYLPWPVSSITWYVWFFAGAAYGLGPAYQVESLRRAKEESIMPGEERRVALAPP